MDIIKKLPQDLIDLEKEYAQNDQLKREDIQALRLKIRDALPDWKPTDLELFLMLHSCYYNKEFAEKTAITYFNMRNQWPEVFKNRNPNSSSMKAHLQNIRLTNEDAQVAYFKLLSSDFATFNLDGYIKIVFAIFDYWIPILGKHDIIVILDLELFSFAQLTKCSISSMKNIIVFLQEALPCRLKAIHFINSNPVVDKIYNLVKIFINKDLYNLLHFHSNMETLYKYVPQICLPKDYGGNDFTVMELQDQMIEVLTANADVLANDDMEEVKEINESFRYIEID